MRHLPCRLSVPSWFSHTCCMRRRVVLGGWLAHLHALSCWKRLPRQDATDHQPLHIGHILPRRTGLLHSVPGWILLLSHHSDCLSKRYVRRGRIGLLLVSATRCGSRRRCRHQCYLYALPVRVLQARWPRSLWLHNLSSRAPMSGRATATREVSCRPVLGGPRPNILQLVWFRLVLTLRVDSV